MRIVGGIYRGRLLKTPEGHGVRPTTDRVREAVFNILEHSDTSIAGTKILDLFSGSGALGLEALSRGARSVLFVEQDAEARGAIRENIESLGATGATRVFRRDATELGEMPRNQGEPYNLTFLDPPYGKGLGPKALVSARDGGWLAPGAVIVFECAADETPDVSELRLDDMRLFGGYESTVLAGRLTEPFTASRTIVRYLTILTPHMSADRDCIDRNSVSLPFRARARSFHRL